MEKTLKGLATHTELLADSRYLTIYGETVIVLF